MLSLCVEGSSLERGGGVPGISEQSQCQGYRCFRIHNFHAAPCCTARHETQHSLLASNQVDLISDPAIDGFHTYLGLHHLSSNGDAQRTTSEHLTASMVRGVHDPRPAA